MASVLAQICGGDIKRHDDVRTVGDLREKLGLGKDNTATLKGEPADDGDKLRDDDFVSFAKATAGGAL